MKKLNKVLASLLSIGIVLGLVSCSTQENSPPEISGVEDETISVGEEFDAMQGVSASDEEDGDLTDKVKIESLPELEFNNGITKPEEAGTYELTYSVSDSQDQIAKAYSTLTVEKATEDEVLFMDFDFDDNFQVDSHGWEADISENAEASAELTKGAYVFSIDDPGESDGDIRLKLDNFEIQDADYLIKVWAVSSKDTYAHLIARDENSEEWSTFGGEFNLEITDQIKPLELSFSSDKNASAELMLNLGKINPNPENESDTTPEDFVVNIPKIEIYEITGDESQKSLYEGNFDASPESINIQLDDEAEAELKAENNSAAISINSYPVDGGIWSIKVDIALPEIELEENQKYYYDFDLSAENDQEVEILVESESQFDELRANFNATTLAANESTHISNIFVSEVDLDDPVIRLQVGAAEENVNENIIKVSNLEFGVMEGDREIDKTIHAFHAFGPDSINSDNPEYPWDTFNGTDEDLERGVGTIWTEDGSLFYRIYEGAFVDWHNKLIGGYEDNSITLEADSYYTVEIEAKASDDINAGFFLNPIGEWDPRLIEEINFTPETQTYSFTTDDTFVVDMPFEMLFQFGSEELVEAGDVTVEIADIKILQNKVK